MITRNVTNTAFVSYPATGVQLPNGRQLANSYDALYRRTLVQDVTYGVNVAAWQFFGPSRVAEVTLGNGLICSRMDNARTNSAVQPSVVNPAWGNRSSDRLGYDGAGRPITKRYLAGGINGSTGAYNNPSAVVGFTTEYDLSSNKFYERHLHCDERSHLYEPFSNGAPTGGYDSVNRLRQYQRGTLTSNDGFAGNGGGSVATPIALPNTDTQRTYDLDSLGNWRRTVFTPEGGSQETEIRQHNGLNEITRIQNGASQTNLTYDGVPGASNGNLANDGTRTYQWDALNRLLQVNRVSDVAIVGQYVYDALNRRIRKTVSNGGLSGTIPNGTTDCVYSEWRCIEERNPFGGGGSTDTPTAQYIWGIYLDECLQQRLLAATNNFAANSDLYPLQDLLYRTTGLADSSGSVREAYDTDAYGNTLIFRNAGTPPAAIAWTDSDTQVNNPTCPFIFTGQRFDAETGNYYSKWRIYNVQFSRFASRDEVPCSRPGLRNRRYLMDFISARDKNPYEYCGNNPTTFLDPVGLYPDDFLTAGAALLGGNVDEDTFILAGKGRLTFSTSGGAWTKKQEHQLNLATCYACGKIYKAKWKLENADAWAKVRAAGNVTLSMPGANPPVQTFHDKEVVYLENESNRQKVIDQLKKVLDRCLNGNPIIYTLDLKYSTANDSPLHTLFIGPIRTSDIYVSVPFFSAASGAQSDAVVHEFGRYILGIHDVGNSTDFENDAEDRFDAIVRYLNR